MKKILLSGIQPTGDMHIGNYFGAIKQFVDLQNDYETYVFIADLHAMTTMQDREKLKKSIFDVTTLQYQKGVVSYTEVLSSEFSYKEAEVNYLQSLVKYLNYKLELDKANNNIQSDK